MSESRTADSEFFVLLTALRDFRDGTLTGYPSDRALARAAGVSPTTIGAWLRGRQFPQDLDRFLPVLRMVAGRGTANRIPDPGYGSAALFDEERWRAAYHQEAAQRANSVSDGVERAQAARALARHAAGRLLAETTDPFALEVHLPVQPDDAKPGLPVLPAYVPREHDSQLAQVIGAAERSSGIVVLVGGSSTGKTRACWEALRLLRDRPEPWRLWHPIDPSRQEAALRDLPLIGPHTVIWLNEAQFYLDAPDGGVGERIAAGLRELLRDPDRGPVLILATLWPQFWETLTARPPAGEDDLHAQARELLSGRDVSVPDAFTQAQLEELSGTGDPRLVLAATAPDGQVIQFLAGARELLARYRNAPPAAKALINAAADARRLGTGIALSLAFLEAAAPGYLIDSDWDGLDDDWLEQALAYTTAWCKGIRGPLSRIRPRIPVQAFEPAYRLADYLDQHARDNRRSVIPPASFWTAAASFAGIEDLGALAEAAEHRGLMRDAARLYKHAATSGDAYSAASLIRLLHSLRPADQNPAHWAAAHAALDDRSAVTRLLNALCRVEAEEQVRVLAARAAAHTALDDPSAVADLLSALRWVGADEQAKILAARAAAHVTVDDPSAVADLLSALHRAGADEQAKILASRATAHTTVDDPSAIARLLSALHRAGADEQAKILAGCAAAHTTLHDLPGVADLLNTFHEVGADEQAAALLARQPAAHTNLDNAATVAELLDELRWAGADELFDDLAARAAAHTALDDPSAIADLLNALHEAGADEQAGTMLARQPAAHTALNNPSAIADLLDALHEAGADEQVKILATRAAAHTALDDLRGVADLLNTLHEAGVGEQVKVLAAHAAAHTTVNDPAAIARLLSALGEAGAGEQVKILATRAAAHTTLDNPPAIAELLQGLRQADAEEQVKILATRAAAHTALDNPAAIARLLSALREAGADEQAAALLAREPGAHTALHNPAAIARLLSALREAGADEQAAALLAREPGAHTALHNPPAIARLLSALREAGADEQVQILATRAAAHTALDNPSAIAELLNALREAGADEQVQILATRAAAHTALDNPSAIAELLNALREAGADEQVQILATRAAAHTAFDNPSAIAELLNALREAGADEQVQILATRAAAHTAFDNPPAIAELLNTLHEAGAEQQVDSLVGRLPGEGLFDLFCNQADHRALYRFGREADGSPTSSWGWDHLD